MFREAVQVKYAKQLLLFIDLINQVRDRNTLIPCINVK